jgi:hypothetical protein
LLSNHPQIYYFRFKSYHLSSPMMHVRNSLIKRGELCTLGVKTRFVPTLLVSRSECVHHQGVGEELNILL